MFVPRQFSESHYYWTKIYTDLVETMLKLTGQILPILILVYSIKIEEKPEKYWKSLTLFKILHMKE